MNKTFSVILGALLLGLSSSALLAEDNCSMPPGIDDDEIYWIHFKSESKIYRYKILDIEDCWVQIYKKNGNPYWYPISDILVITSNPEKD
jgi:predicted metalloprotease